LGFKSNDCGWSGMFGGVASRRSSRNNHASATLPTPIALRARKRRRDQSPVASSAECQVGFIENGQINGRRRQPGKFKYAWLPGGGSESGMFRVAVGNEIRQQIEDLGFGQRVDDARGHVRSC